MGANQVKDKQEFFSQLKVAAKGWGSKQIAIADVIKQVSHANRNKEIAAFATRNNVKLSKFKFEEEFATVNSKKITSGVRLTAQFVTHQPIFIPCCGIMLRLAFSSFYYAAGSCSTNSTSSEPQQLNTVEATCYQLGKVHITTSPLQVGNQPVRVNMQGTTMLAKFECFDSFIKWSYFNPNLQQQANNNNNNNSAASPTSNSSPASGGSSFFSALFQSASSSDDDLMLTNSIRIMYSLPNCSTPVDALLELGKQLDVLSRKDCQPIVQCLSIGSANKNSPPAPTMSISAQCLFTNFVCDSVYNPSGLCFPIEKRFDFDPGFKLKLIKPSSSFSSVIPAFSPASVPITPRNAPQRSFSNVNDVVIEAEDAHNTLSWLYFDRALIHEEDGDFMFTNRDNELQPQLRFTLPPKLSVKRKYKSGSSSSSSLGSSNKLKSIAKDNGPTVLSSSNITAQVGSKVMNSSNTATSVLDAILIFFNRDEVKHLSRELLHMPCKKFVCNAGFKVNNKNNEERSITVAAPKTFSISIAPGYHRYLKSKLHKGKFYTSLDGQSFQFDTKQEVELHHGPNIKLLKLNAETSDGTLVIGDNEQNSIDNMYQFLNKGVELRLAYGNTFEIYTLLQTLKVPTIAKFDLTTCMVSYKSSECEVRWNFEMERGTLVLNKDQRVKKSIPLNLPLEKSRMHRALWEQCSMKKNGNVVVQCVE